MNQTEALVKSTTSISNPEDLKEFRKRLESFQKQVNQKPTKVLSHKEGFKYVPIDNVKKQLARNFFGLTQLRNFRWERMGNEIVGAIELWYVHPVTNEWMMQEGAAAVIIRQDEKTKLEDFMQVKKKNALVLDFPHLKSECIKNAAAELGDLFGGNLRRDYQETYQGLYRENSDEAPALTQEQKDYMRKIDVDISLYESSNELRSKTETIIKHCKEMKLPKFYITQIEQLIQTKYQKLLKEKK